MSKIKVVYTIEFEFDSENEMALMNRVSTDAAKNSKFHLRDYIESKANYLFRQKAKDVNNFTRTTTEA